MVNLAGYDKTKLSNPKEHIREFTSNRSLFYAINRRLQETRTEENFRILPEVGGIYCGCNIYKYDNLIGIEGLINKTKIWKKIQPREYDRFLRALRAAVNYINDEFDGAEDDAKELYAMSMGFLREFHDKSAENKTAMATLARTFYPEEPVKRVTLTGKDGAFKFVPSLESFPAVLQALDARKLLTLFPDAEASQLMLMLGRVVCGASETELMEGGQLEHTFRSYGIMVGMEAGLGKSTFMKYLRSTLSKLGYIIDDMHVNDTKFGWGGIAKSDLALIDDLNAETQKRLLSDARVKSLVSNGYLKVEEKGQPAVSVRATTVILGATNHHNASDYIGMDSGSISRVNQMDTMNSYELSKYWGTDRDYRLKQYWEEEAKRYGVSTDCLCAYLLRRCADLFMKVCGYVYDYGWQKSNPDLLEEIVKGNRSLFNIDTNLNHAEELVRASAEALAMTVAENPELEERAMSLDFNASIVVAIASHFAHAKEEDIANAYSALSLHHMSRDVKAYIKAKGKELESMKAHSTADGAFKSVMSELRSTKGFGYPQHVSHYIPMWNSYKRMIPAMKAKYIDGALTTNLGILISTVRDIILTQQ